MKYSIENIQLSYFHSENISNKKKQQNILRILCQFEWNSLNFIDIQQQAKLEQIQSSINTAKQH
jgi:hypothetical protein